MEINTVLVADAVDNACIDILKKYSVKVDCKYKLPKDELIQIIKVSYQLETIYLISAIINRFKCLSNVYAKLRTYLSITLF